MYLLNTIVKDTGQCIKKSVLSHKKEFVWSPYIHRYIYTTIEIKANLFGARHVLNSNRGIIKRIVVCERQTGNIMINDRPNYNFSSYWSNWFLVTRRIFRMCGKLVLIVWECKRTTLETADRSYYTIHIPRCRKLYISFKMISKRNFRTFVLRKL